jgi:hypothetical protein
MINPGVDPGVVFEAGSHWQPWAFNNSKYNRLVPCGLQPAFRMACMNEKRGGEDATQTNP